MRRLAALSALCLACLCAAPAAAAAEWHITPMVGLTFGGNTTIQDPDRATEHVHPNLAVSVAALSSGILGAEAIAGITPGFFQTSTGQFIDSSRMSVVMGNAVLTAPRHLTEYFLRPFVSGGFGLIRASERDVPILGVHVIDIKTNLAGFNIGGGAIGFLTKTVGVRFDLRYYSTLHSTKQDGVAFGDTHLRYMVASVGLVIR